MKIVIANIIIYCGTVAVLLSFLISCNERNQAAQNLIINGSAELPKYDSTPQGWLNIRGSWKSVEGDTNSHGYAWAQEGKYHFFEGKDSLGILQQDINLTPYASNIDDHQQQFLFSGYVKSFPQDPPDQTQIILTALDNSKNKSPFTLNSDTISSVNKWQQVTDSFVLPVSTRFLRIQLIAHRRNGSDNDGYFDNMILTASPVKMGLSWILIALAVVACLSAGIIIIIKRGKLPNSG